jgi:magnesium-transporting ATPase (P-type)
LTDGSTYVFWKEKEYPMNQQIKKLLLILSIIVVSIVAYLLIAQSYLFEEQQEMFGIASFIVKSGFVIADMCLITAVLLHGSKERGGSDDTK